MSSHTLPECLNLVLCLVEKSYTKLVWKLLDPNPKKGFRSRISGGKRSTNEDASPRKLLTEVCQRLETSGIPSMVYQRAPPRKAQEEEVKNICFDERERVYGIFLLLSIDYLAVCDKRERDKLFDFESYVGDLLLERDRSPGYISSSSPKWTVSEYAVSRRYIGGSTHIEGRGTEKRKEAHAIVRFSFSVCRWFETAYKGLSSTTSQYNATYGVRE